MRLRCVAVECPWESQDLHEDLAEKALNLHMLHVHPVPTTQPQVGGTGVKKPEKFPRPTIDQDSTLESWNEFISSWEQYKDEYQLTGTALTRQLQACCSSELKTSLSRTSGGAHFTLTESQMLSTMKQLAVKFQNPAVNVQEFLGMFQQGDEGVRYYLSRLRGVASRCQFEVSCTCGNSVSYSDQVIRFKLIAGLHDIDIKEDILSTEDKDLEETVKLIENKESGRQAKKTVGAQNHGMVNKIEPEGKQRSCTHCGRNTHGSSRTERESNCPAYNQKCLKCGGLGHFMKVCKSKKKVGANEVMKKSVDAESNQISVGKAGLMAVTGALNKVARTGSKIKVPHMLYEQLQWVQRSPPGHPTCVLSLTVSTKGYNDNGFRPPPATRRRNADMTCMADTGCQACCMGPRQLYKLGMTEADLLEPILSLSAANKTGITILGAVYLVISGMDKADKLWKTNQLCYVAKGVDQFLLSREACQQLGMLPSSFPEVGAYEVQLGEQDNDMITREDNADMLVPDFKLDITPCSPRPDGTCSCPRRAPPPPPPPFRSELTRTQMKKQIIEHYAASAFNRCTRQTLPMMKGDPLHIITDPAAMPVATHSPIPVPLHWEERVKQDLERDVALGVIEPVPVNTPVTWCARMVIVPKHDGTPRRTVDLQGLNRASVRQTFHTRTPFMLATDVPANTVKSVLDVWNSFHSVPVREEDRDKLTFLTPWGRYKYCVAPQGYLASGDGYTQRFADITKEISNKRTIIDDTVIWGEDLKENFQQVCQLLEMCSKAGLVFNSDKFQFGKETVEFAGLEITSYGVRPSKKFLDAIRAFPRPENISEMRSFFGMINQVSYAFAMSETMEPFRHLLRPGTRFTWSPALQECFNKAKEKIVEAVQEGVRHFEIDRPTCLACDWSKAGVGFFLLQKWCKCQGIHPRCCNDGWRLVLAGGRFTSPAESRYSVTEGECLAVVDALHKARHFVLGCPDLIIATDHQPLLGLLNDKSLADIGNPRLLSLKEKTLWFSFRVVYVPGRKHCGPDYMSRHGLSNDEKQEMATTKETRIACILGMIKAQEESGDYDKSFDTGVETGLLCNISTGLNMVEGLRAVTFDRVKREVLADETMVKLRDTIYKTPYDQAFPAEFRDFNKIRHELHVLDEVPMYGTRVIVPPSLRREVLGHIHAAHQSVGKMYDRAMQVVYWPGLYTDIEGVRSACEQCNKTAPSQPAIPPFPLASPEFPHQMIVGDYCSIKGKTWLIIADRFSGWISVYYFSKEATAAELVKILKTQFSTFGVAENFSSDDGSQFRSHTFQEFLKLWGVTHRISSDYNPHSNLRAESAVKTAKRLLTDNTRSDGSPDWDRIVRAIMQHRNTPLNDINLSPAQIIFGRPVRDFLPVKPDLYRPQDVWVDNAEKRELALKRRLYKGLERWSEHTRSQPALEPGQNVYIQNQRGPGKASKQWDRSGVVLENKGFDKYSVKVDGSGRVTDRNRRFLRAFKPSEGAKMFAPRFSVEEGNDAMREQNDLVQRQNVHSNVPGTDDNPSVVIDGHKDPPPVVVGTEPAEVEIPLPQTSPSARTPPPAAPSPVARSQRLKKPSSLLNPDIWDLNTVQTVLSNFVPKSSNGKYPGRKRRSRGKGHS